MATLFELDVNLAKGLRDKDKNIARLLAHRDDPKTSREAAEKMVESGKLSEQERGVLAEIESISYWYKWDNFTARELSDQSILYDYHTIQRRLSRLRRKGKIERIQIGKERIGATNTFKPIYKKRDGCCVWKLVYRS